MVNSILILIIDYTECSFVWEQICIMDNKVIFNYSKEKQKLLIHAILSCSNLNLIDIALLLDVSYDVLCQVYQGINYLNDIYALRLMKLFTTCFIDEG